MVNRQDWAICGRCSGGKSASFGKSLLRADESASRIPPERYEGDWGSLRPSIADLGPRVKRDYEYIVRLRGFRKLPRRTLALAPGRHDVLGLEQFELGHVRGESQDHSRIIRLSYHTPAYVELAKPRPSE